MKIFFLVALVVVNVLPVVLVFGRGEFRFVMRGFFFAVVRCRASTLATTMNGDGGMSSDEGGQL